MNGRSLGPGYPELSTAECAEGDLEHMLPVNPMSALCLGHVVCLPPFLLRHTSHGAHEDIFLEYVLLVQKNKFVSLVGALIY